MLNFIKNLFPYRAKSIEEFVEFVKREGCGVVTAKPYERFDELCSEPVSVCAIRFFQYILELTAKTPQGRKIVCQSLLFERFGSYGGFADGGNRKDATRDFSRFAGETVEVLRKELPDMSVEIIWPAS